MTFFEVRLKDFTQALFAAREPVPHSCHWNAEGGCDFVVAHVRVELHDDCFTPLCREQLECHLDEFIDFIGFDRLIWLAVEVLDKLGMFVSLCEHVHARCACDCQKVRRQVGHLAVRRNTAEKLQEGSLKGIFSVLRVEENLAAVRVDALSIAPVDFFERTLPVLRY